MSIPIRGLKRQEIINNWLNGVEDPDYEVVPTRAEGKYIVKTRDNKPLAVEIPNTDSAEMQLAAKRDDKSQSASPEVENSDKDDHEAEINKNDDTENITVETTTRDYISFDRELTNEILNQLKMINDDRKARDEKKQKKKELRRAIHKEFARSRVVVEGSSDEEEPQPVYIERPPPIRVRRRLNLLDRYK